MDTPTRIVANLVPEDKRMSVLPDFFGFAQMLLAEGMTFDYMQKLSIDYNGGHWHYYRLSNGGFYMAPSEDKPMRVQFNGNGYEGTMSADAAGLTATLFMLNSLANSLATDKMIDLYYLVRDFASEHAEITEIFKAID
jgi:hypothetical protein